MKYKVVKDPIYFDKWIVYFKKWYWIKWKKDSWTWVSEKHALERIGKLVTEKK